MKNKQWGIILDSLSGFTKKEVEKDGSFFVPIKMSFGNEEFSDGVDIKQEEVISRLNNGQLVKTSTASVGEIQSIFDEALTKFDKILVISISKHLSGVNNAFQLAAKEKKYADKIVVLDSLLNGPWIYHYYPMILQDAKNGVSIDEVVRKLTIIQNDTFGAFVPEDLKFLGKSGRVSPSQAMIGNALGIIPVLIWKDGKIDPKETLKKRSFKKAAVAVSEHFEILIQKKNMKLDNIFLVSNYWPREEEDSDSSKIIENLGGIKLLDYNPILSSAMISHLGPAVRGWWVSYDWGKI